MIPSALKQFLNASRGKVEWFGVDEETARHFQTVIEGAFPGFHLQPQFVSISSAKRRCEIRLIDDQAYLIFDWQAISTIAQFDYLAELKQEIGDLGTMVTFSLYGDGFCEKGNFRYYQYVVRRLHGDSHHLRDLAQGCRSRNLFSRSVLFVIFHELMHLIFRTDREKLQVLEEFVESATTTFHEKVREMLSDPGAMESWSFLCGTQMNEAWKNGLEKDLPKYEEVIDKSSALREELVCDLGALFAYINYICGSNLFDSLVLPRNFETLKKVGDCLMMGAKSLKGSLTILSVFSIVQNIEEEYEGENLKAPLIESTIRSNVLVFLCSTLYKTFCGEEVAGSSDRIFRLPDTWMATYTDYIEKYGSRILDQVELVEGYFSDKERLNREIECYALDFPNLSFENSFDTKLDADALRFTDTPLAKDI